MQILTDDGVVVAGGYIRDLDLMAALQDAEVLGQGVGYMDDVVSLPYTPAARTSTHRYLEGGHPWRAQSSQPCW